MPTQYDEFRIQVSPDVLAPAQLALQILESPVQLALGPAGMPEAVFSRADLALLHDNARWPMGGNLGELQRIGSAAYRAVTNVNVTTALGAAMTLAVQQNRGLRIVFSTIAVDAPQAGIRVSEIPIEMIFTQLSNFYAPQLSTPVSRSLQARPDRPSVSLALPLRILLVAASPNNWPQANIQQEIDTIRTVLKNLIDSRLVVLDVCTPPTRMELNNRLRSAPYHVVHFAGHGGVGRIGGDPTPRAFLCMETDTRDLDALDGSTLDTILRNSPTVNLVVITGCSTARLPTPIGSEPFATSAFDGIAQRLISPGTPSNVSAVVAMQFDLDAVAAEAFSRRFYEMLLKPDITIDEAVTEARLALVAAFTLGSPSWANPVLYWRCQNGRPFNVQPFTIPPLSPEDEKKITIINLQIAAYRNNLQELTSQPAAVQETLRDYRDSLVTKINGFLAQIGEIRGNAIRLRGGKVRDDGTLDFVLTARLQSAAQLDRVKVKISYEEAAFDVVSVSKGADVPNGPLSANGAGILDLSIDHVTAGAVRAAGEFEIGVVRMRVKDRTQSTRVATIIGLDIDATPDRFYSSVDGYAFV